MFPYADHNPHNHFPLVTWTLIAANVAVFIYQMTVPEAALFRFYDAFGMVPAQLLGGGLDGGAGVPMKGVPVPPSIAGGIPEPLTVFTSMFLHGDAFHLFGNMLFLWVFGDNVEVALGRVKFLLFYLLCGIAAAAAQTLSAPDSIVPMIGASGAISGVLGAYIMLFPRATIRVLLIIIPLSLPAVVVLGIYFGMQVFFATSTPSDVEGGVAFWAHVGGFVAGMVLVPFMKRSGVQLFQRGHFTGPWVGK